MKDENVPFKTFVVSKTADNTFVREIRRRMLNDLPPGELIVRVLRSVSLIGVDSAQCPDEQRMEAWQRLANDWKAPRLTDAVVKCTLVELEETIHTMLTGRMIGRVVVDLTGS